MKNSKEIIRGKKWTFLLVFLIIFLNPCFFFWADNLLPQEKRDCLIIAFFVFCALSGISLFLKNKGEKIFLGILYLMSLIPNTVVWSYLYLSDTYMCRDMFWVLFGTNYSESKEYMEQFITWPLFTMSALYIVAGIFLWFKAGTPYSLRIRKYKAFFIVCVAIVVATFSFQYLTKAVSTFDFYVSGIKFHWKNEQMKKEIELRKGLKIDVSCNLPDSTKQVFVVIIGESLTRTHMHLYGYPRQTTPLLDERKNTLDIYTDVITPDNHTIAVMKKLLTFADHDHPDYYLTKPSMIEMFKSAGFETYWISNQEFISKWGGSYGVIAEEADHVYNLRVAQKPDEIVLPALEEVLRDTVFSKKMIFVHLMGSHHLYSARYPDTFKYFDYRKNPLPDKPFLKDWMRKVIDEYDNSVRYTDFVVNGVIERVNALNASSFVLFFSDHGEEIFDVRAASGHAMNNVTRGQCEIPFIMWRSDDYKKEKTDLVIDTGRPSGIEYLIYGLSSLAGLEYKDYLPSRSLFSREYQVPERRMVGNEDYDREIIKKTY